jgi:hypothetical protein
LTKNDIGGTAVEGSVLTGLGPLSMFFEHTQFFDFLSERESNSGDSVLSRSQTRLDSSIPSWKFIPRIPWSITGAMQVRESGAKLFDLSNRLSVLLFGVSASNTTEWSLTRGGESEPSTTGSGSVQLSGRMKNINLRGDLSYGLLPDTVFNNASLTGDYKISQDFSASVGLNKQLIGDGLTSYNASLNRRFTAFAIGVTASYDNTGAFAAGTSITYSLGREPRKGSWRHSSDRMASSGMASVRAFLDNNANQVFDEGDQPLKDVKFRPGGEDQKTNEDGIVLLRGLSSSVPTNIVLDMDSLEDPFWVPFKKGYEVIGRPGRPFKLDFPVTPTGEIDGTVYLVSGDSEKPVGNVQIQLVNDKQEVLQEIKSEYDGFYLIQLVPQGKYTLQIAPEQIKRLGLKTPESKEIVIEGAEILQSGMDIQLELANPKKSKKGKAKPIKEKKEKTKLEIKNSKKKKSTSDKSIDEKKPVDSKSSSKEPADKKTASEKPIIDKSVDEKKSIGSKPSSKEPADKKPASEKPVSDKPVDEKKPAAPKPPIKEPAKRGPVHEQQASLKPLI